VQPTSNRRLILDRIDRWWVGRAACGTASPDPINA
jgi:hypothetical protein